MPGYIALALRLQSTNPGTSVTAYSEESNVLVILLGLLLVALFLGLGFAIHALWIVAVVFFIAWIAGFAFRSGEGSRRWYRW